MQIYLASTFYEGGLPVAERQEEGGRHIAPTMGPLTERGDWLTYG